MKALNTSTAPMDTDILNDLEALRFTYESSSAEKFTTAPKRHFIVKPQSKDYDKLYVDLVMLNSYSLVERLGREDLIKLLAQISDKAKDLKGPGDLKLEQIKSTFPDTLEEHMAKHASSRQDIEQLIEMEINEFIEQDLWKINPDPLPGQNSSDLPYISPELRKLLPEARLYNDLYDRTKFDVTRGLINQQIMANRQKIYDYYYQAIISKKITHLINEGSFYDPSNTTTNSKRNNLAEGIQKKLMLLPEFSDYQRFTNFQVIMNAMTSLALAPPESKNEIVNPQGEAAVALDAVYRVAKEVNREEILLDLLTTLDAPTSKIMHELKKK